ncbi:hypothetical protein GCM10007874_15800 [Labrys miyagiensis]|uniref:Uncharacterized protein n=1 Tax=Labrys miyagiensis TaxID=346912 RepID=A0ABQ6CFW6_9HYPH|nr:hypothetical protein GCM10007874_15800 [Labrys miyagiensis]
MVSQPSVDPVLRIADILGDPRCAHRRLREGIAGQSIGAVKAGASNFTASPQAGERGAAKTVNGNTTHMIMNGRSYWYRHPRRIDAGQKACPRDLRESLRECRPELGACIEEDRMPAYAVAPDPSRNLITRSEFRSRQVFQKALTRFVDQDSALSPHRFTDQPHRPRRRVERRGMELDEFEV